MSTTENDHKNEIDHVRAHTYDGIEEFDNPLPGWWKWSFYASIFWAVFYLIGIGVGYVPTYEDDLATEDKALALMVQNYNLKNPKPKLTPDEIAALISAPGAEARGQEVYTANCASCHGPQGQGLIGPNLTDAYWMYGGSLMDVFKIVDKGSPNVDAGMPPWGPILKPADLYAVVGYVQSIGGTTPANPKAPQGALYVPEAKGEPDDAPKEEGSTPDPTKE